MKKSEELYKTLRQVRFDAMQAIYDLMEHHSVTEVDLTEDRCGLHPGDYEYDEDSMWDSHVIADCYGKHGNEDGIVQKVYISNDGTLDYAAKGEETGYIYDGVGYVEDDAYIWTAILEWMENRF